MSSSTTIMSSSTDRNEQSRRTLVWVAVGIAVAVAIATRFWMLTFGSNFDFVSYRIVAEIQTSCGNVYANTPRYNYGPPWFLTLGWLWNVANLTPRPVGFFRVEIIALLTAADLALAWILYRRHGIAAGLIVLLAPIGIIVSGYHNQFDNVAIVLGIVAVLVMRDKRHGPIGLNEWVGIGLLALSLSLKHVLIVFPLWLAIRQETWRRRVAYLVLPVLLFAASFSPWLSGGGLTGIMENVFGYQSSGSAPLLSAILRNSIPDETLVTLASVTFVIALGAGAWLTRRIPSAEALFVYLLVVVVFSPGMANQYFAIPLAAVAAFPNALLIIWIAVVTLFLAGDAGGLDSSTVRALLPSALRSDRVGFDAYQVPTVLLATGGFFAWWKVRNASRQTRDSSSRDSLSKTAHRRHIHTVQSSTIPK